MARSVETVLLLGRNVLAHDVARRLAASDRERRVVTISTVGEAAPGERVIDLTSFVGTGQLAEILQELRPSMLVLLAFSESPVTPERPWLQDAAVADAVATAMRKCADLKLRLPSLLALSSTAVYGVAPGSPLLFDEACEGVPIAPLSSAFDRWADGLRQAEATLLSLREELRIAVALLRSASVVGGPIDSPLQAWLSAALPVRVLGFDPPVQVLDYEDLVEAVVLAIEQRSAEILNIVGRGAVSLSRLLALSGTVALPLAGPLADRLTSDAMDGKRLRWRALADGRRAMQALGFRPARSTEETLRARR
ncbi:MAG: hypothetical protein HY899_07215 [Deltaproteobacteria bacterium]|nr:hypothetical protein [Deltaproteobacteria bacterium]